MDGRIRRRRRKGRGGKASSSTSSSSPSSRGAAAAAAAAGGINSSGSAISPRREGAPPPSPSPPSQPLCRLGKMCQNPLCPTCFPKLQKRPDGNNDKKKATANIAATATAWEGTEEGEPLSSNNSGATLLQQQHQQSTTTPPASPPPQVPLISRAVSADLVELVVVVCTSNGTRQNVLKAIRCNRNDTLYEIRNRIIPNEIPSLFFNNRFYSFLRIVAGHVVVVTTDQESGPKAYKAKHFAPPHALSPQLLICYNSDKKMRAQPPVPPTTATCSNLSLQRQVTEGMIEFCVRIMTEGRREYDETEEDSNSFLGMVRLHRDATMSEIRNVLAVQLPQTVTPMTKYKFVRMLDGEVTLLTRAQEGGGDDDDEDDIADDKKPLLLRAYHFAPPYTSKAELILLTRKTYREGEIVQDETKIRELKSLSSAIILSTASPQQQQHRQQKSSNHPRGRGKNPRDMVKEKVAQYVNAFLNSAGGVLIFGANDDGVIERVPISGSADHNCKTLEDRVMLARAVKDDIRKLVDGISVAMDPVVDDDLVTTVFVPVLPRKRDDDYEGTTTTTTAGEVNKQKAIRAAAEEEIYNVIEVHVKPGRRPLYFLDEHSSMAYERRDGSTHLMDRNTIAEALDKASTEDGDLYSKWRGGWRQLRSSFDFDPLMRRLSDPWAGREWLFAAVRQSLFRSLLQLHEQPSQGAKIRYSGVGIIGARGMGKTSFMSELALRPAHVTNINVVAHHLCRADDPDTLNPALFVHSLAAMLVRRCKEYRFLMTDSSTHPGRDYMSAAMLRVLRPEHCESDPEDALLRGILQPMREIEVRRDDSKNQDKEKQRIPMVIVVDAIDESLAAESDMYHGRRGSSTIAHLLERAIMSDGFSHWIKLILSFRREMVEVPGPIQRLAQRLDLIDLDPELTNITEVQRDRDDIRLFVEAYMERNRMASPLGSHVGSGKWNFEMAATAAKRLRNLGDYKNVEWQYEAQPRKWARFDDLITTDIHYATSTNLRHCYYMNGKQLFLANLETKTQQNVRSGKVQEIRMVENAPFESGSGKISESARGNLGVECYSKRDYPSKKVDYARKRAEREALLKRENALLESLASNSQGNYLYARSLLEDVGSGRLSWEQVPSIPPGLDHLYTLFFRVHFGDGVDVDGTDTRSKPSFRGVKPVLEVLLAATKRGVTERDIAHAVFVGGACDPTTVPFCLRDIRWALDIDNSKALPRYSLRHESIRAWLRDDSNATFGLREQHGHKLLAASLIQRCWPQQAALSSWLDSGKESPCNTVESSWYQWSDWKPNGEDEDIFNLVNHLIGSDLGEDDEKVSLLKSIGEQTVNSVYRGKTTAMHSAAATANTKAIKLLLDAGAAPDVPVRGRRPLHLAAAKGYSKTVDMLLSAGADVSSRTSHSGRTALLNAASRGSASAVKSILDSISELEKSAGYERDDKSERALVDASQSDTGRTPLSVAAEEGHDEVIGLLIGANASVFLADRLGRTPLYYAARYGRVGAEAAKALASAPRGQETLKWGECKHNRSPLHTAVWNGHVALVKVLLESNADPNLVDRDGKSPLHEAVCYMERTRRKNQSTETRVEGSSNMQEVSITTCNDSVDEREESVRLEILQLLLGTGRCTVDLREVHGCTPLWYAAGGGWTRAVELLLDADADPDPPSDLPSSEKSRQCPVPPLMHAIDRGHYEAAATLLARGAHLQSSLDVEALISSKQIPEEFVNLLRGSIIQKERPPTISKNSFYTIETVKQCEPIPSDAFAQPSEA